MLSKIVAAFGVIALAFSAWMTMRPAENSVRESTHQHLMPSTDPMPPPEQNGEVKWLLPASDSAPGTNGKITCEERDAQLRTAPGKVFHVHIATAYRDAQSKPTGDDCHMVLTVADSDGLAVYRSEWDNGAADEMSSYSTKIGVASLIPGSDQLVISNSSCGGSCDLPAIAFLSFNSGIAEILEINGDGLKFPDQASYDISWKVSGHKVIVSSSWYRDAKSAIPMKIAVGFDPSTGVPFVEGSESQKQYFREMFAHPHGLALGGGTGDAATTASSTAQITPAATCGDFSDAYQQGSIAPYIEFAMQQFAAFDQQRLASGRGSLGIPKPDPNYWARICGSEASRTFPFYDAVALHYKVFVAQNCAPRGCN